MQLFRDLVRAVMLKEFSDVSEKLVPIIQVHMICRILVSRLLKYTNMAFSVC
jgi:hypothetical protein